MATRVDAHAAILPGVPTLGCASLRVAGTCHGAGAALPRRGACRLRAAPRQQMLSRNISSAENKEWNVREQVQLVPKNVSLVKRMV